ncbi:tyrosine-type recombinase/integrase [Variovorax ginsengisoli]|uniref:Integrase n=1 Tax=Variovorax ginsengisoli TaxID=363844 RepID=A0ABT9SAC3_9BURK|nr:tyrosine-type recombinase/integrase [Variovorax ginsengisoli]MDP9900783.1 integrase [Variovorax ginsengisoli]
MHTLPLFDAPRPDAHGAAFEAWLEDQRAMGLLQRTGSIQVYRDMWGGFTAWCLGQSPVVRLTDLTVNDLQAFQAARMGKKSADLSLSPRHALRLLRLIDRVLNHMAAQQGEPPNTAAADCIAAQPEVRFAEAADADPMPDFLSVSEARQLIAFVSQARPRPSASGVPRDAGASLSWQMLRNRASVALQLGGGLTPADVRALTLSSPTVHGGRVRDRPWKLDVPGNGNSPGRETPIAPWAGELLHHWLQVRSDVKIPGPHLFPSTRTGKPWSKNAQYLAAKGVLEEAGVDSRDGGSYRLRHTFVLRQLRRGTSPEQVARWLGIEPEAMGRYARLIATPEDVV